MSGRPLALGAGEANQLHRQLALDSALLCRNNIIDYSLLTILDKKRRVVRFGIIDYLQFYTLKRQLETQYKTLVNLGQMPTIIEPKAYGKRFCKFAGLFFIGVPEESLNKIPSDARRQELIQLLQKRKQRLKEMLEERVGS